MNRISGWKRGVASGVEVFANDSGAAFGITFPLTGAVAFVIKLAL
jgi:hypothetical protein